MAKVTVAMSGLTLGTNDVVGAELKSHSGLSFTTGEAIEEMLDLDWIR